MNAFCFEAELQYEMADEYSQVKMKKWHEAIKQGKGVDFKAMFDAYDKVAGK